MQFKLAAVMALFAAASSVLAAPLARRTISYTAPDQNASPGELCAPGDINAYPQPYYPAGITKCRRNVGTGLKDQIAAAYGIARSDYSSVEFDHLIPLGIGGDDSAANLWPQPLADAHVKDKVELAAFDQLSSGAIDQRAAVQMICDWLNTYYFNGQAVYSASTYGL
ncbi:hypothetical protein BDZ88DRAFT_505994 [Geranomyces variabilis]|nr:hypothetical protein BDZ88DRAFT_505994 [Geranomyces variabilis]KAJ3137151.1 hypothetical protein HDU90_002323 [Geranomyces variabilis]